jgi:hypothetical protein
MRLHVFLGQEPCRYKGEHAPEVLACWDEFCVDINPDEWDKTKEKALEDRGGESTFVATKEVVVNAPDLYKVFDEVEIKGKVET